MQQPEQEQRFGSLLRSYRANTGLTQEQLAERAGLSRRGIADLERGARRAPFAHTVWQLAAALGLSGAEHAALIWAARHGAVSRPGATAGLQTAGRPEAGPGPTARHNLPLQPTSSIGRDTHRSHVATLLNSSPLVTLVGPGGVGKTRLALEVAADQVDQWPDGVWLVELAPLTEEGLLPHALAAATGVREEPGQPLLSALISALAGRNLLLVLDNCEHLVDACARLASRLVHTCPDVRVVATSREVLGVEGETIWRVEPLTVPGVAPSSAESALESEAVRLFVDRATAAAPGFKLTDQTASAVSSICERLDGLPLALELTAARIRTLSLEDVVRLLDRRFTLLTSGNRTSLPRHRTLRALVDWSYDRWTITNADCSNNCPSSLGVGHWMLSRKSARRRKALCWSVLVN